jgi:predicted transcriptional regulator
MKLDKQIQARKLRTAGNSVKQIAKILKVSKSSVSLWARDIELTTEQRRVLDDRQIVSRLLVSRKIKLAADKRHANFVKEGYGLAMSSEEFRLLVALYWGEGTKSMKQKSFRFTNSDACMIRKVFGWLCANAFPVALRVSYYEENGLPQSVLQQWWLEKIPGLAAMKFDKAKISRASQRKNIGKLPYGTATLYSNTRLFFMVMGGIDFLAGR